MGLVLPGDRRRPLPGRRHLVADRDRGDHDQRAPRCHHVEARERDVSAAGHPSRHRRRRGQGGGRPGRRLPRARASVAVDAARDLGGPAAVSRHLLEPLRREVLRGRRRQARRRGVLLAARPGRRHHARVGPQHLHDRGRVGVGRPSRRCRGGGGRQGRRHHRAGDRGVRDAPRRASSRATSWSRSCAITCRSSSAPIAKPKTILFTEELPKTRSGKIMRRLLRDVAQDQALGDTTTLADPTVVDGIKSRYLATAPTED